jgi:hypothetical protein
MVIGVPLVVLGDRQRLQVASPVVIPPSVLVVDLIGFRDDPLEHPVLVGLDIPLCPDKPAQSYVATAIRVPLRFTLWDSFTPFELPD